MAFNLSNPIGTGTDSELLDLYRACLAKIAVSGQEYQIGDRTFTAADIAEVRTTISWLESRISAADVGGFAVNYATRGRAL